MLNRNTDIIRDGDKDYIKVNSENSLIRKMAEKSADTAYSFGILLGAKVDAETADEMQGTYWVGAQVNVDNIQDVEIVRL